MVGGFDIYNTQYWANQPQWWSLSETKVIIGIVPTMVITNVLPNTHGCFRQSNIFWHFPICTIIFIIFTMFSSQRIVFPNNSWLTIMSSFSNKVTTAKIKIVLLTPFGKQFEKSKAFFPLENYGDYFNQQLYGSYNLSTPKLGYTLGLLQLGRDVTKASNTNLWLQECEIWIKMVLKLKAQNSMDPWTLTWDPGYHYNTTRRQSNKEKSWECIHQFK